MNKWSAHITACGLFAAASFALVLNSSAVAQAATDINISRTDFIPDRPAVLKEARELTALAPTLNGTADYARRYNRLQRDAARTRPGISEWPAADRDTLQSVPTPTDAAKADLTREERESADRQEKRAAETEAAWAQRTATARQRRRQDLEQQRTDTAARDAEARAREAEARANAYDGYGSYPYWGSGWVGHYPRPRPTPLPTKPIKYHLGNDKYIKLPGPVRQ